MRRYLFNESLKDKSVLDIEGDLYKHIIRACRVSVGQKIELLADEKAYLVEVISIEKTSASLSILESRVIEKIKKPYVHLVLANPKPTVYEAVVEKAVELGVKSIHSLTTENSFLKNVERLKSKEARIQKIINQAMQQTGRVEPLELKPFKEFGDFLAAFQVDVKTGCVSGYLLYESSEEKSNQLKVSINNETTDVYLLVGGEGGFTPTEAGEAVSAGFKEVSLGVQILRVETACVAGISILKSELGVW